MHHALALQSGSPLSHVARIPTLTAAMHALAVPALADTLSPFIPGQRLQQMTQPRPEGHAHNNGLQPKTSLNGKISDAAV